MSENNTDNTNTGTPEVPKVDKAKYDKALIDGRNALTRAEALEAELKEFKKIVSSPDEAFALKSAVAANETTKAGGNPEEVEKIVKNRVEEIIKKQYQPELEQIKTQKTTLEQKLHKLEVVGTAMEKIKDKFDPSILKLVEENFISKYARKDDEGKIYFVDDEGKTRYKNSKVMDETDFASELIELYPPMAANKPSNNSRPSGESRTSRNASQSLSPEAIMQLPAEQQKEAWRQHGLINKI